MRSCAIALDDGAPRRAYNRHLQCGETCNDGSLIAGSRSLRRKPVLVCGASMGIGCAVSFVRGESSTMDPKRSGSI